MLAGESPFGDAGGALGASDVSRLFGEHRDRGTLLQHPEQLERAEDVQELEALKKDGSHLYRSGGRGHGGEGGRGQTYFFASEVPETAAVIAANSGPFSSSPATLTAAMTSSE